MIGILNAEEALEDPFSGDGLDIVRISHLFDAIQEDMNLIDDSLI